MADIIDQYGYAPMYEDEDIPMHDCRAKFEHEVLKAIAAIQNLISHEQYRLSNSGDIGITGITLIRLKLAAYEDCLAAVTEALR
jgi:hypothetical protein